MAPRRLLDTNEIANRCRHFARIEARGYSPLYERLALALGEDDELLTIAAKARAEHLHPYLFLGAVHLLILRGVEHPLAAAFPDAPPTAARRPGASSRNELHIESASGTDVSGLFHDFCVKHREELQAVVGNRLVQTNEVGRSAALLPAFILASRAADGRPLALVEVGASAGLNLIFDRYSYEYGDGLRAGASDSPVVIRCETHGPLRPPVAGPLPLIADRVGIDLHPIDVDDAGEREWLRALVWPEHRRRAETLERALELAREAPPRLIQGDAVELLPEVVGSLPQEVVPCIFHTATLAHFSLRQRQAFPESVAGLGWQRDLIHVSGEAQRPGPREHELRISTFTNGRSHERLLARYHPHGAWIEWLEAATALPVSLASS